MDAAELEAERGEDQSKGEYFGCRHDTVGDATPAVFLFDLCDDERCAGDPSDDDDELDELPLFQPSASTGLDARIARGVIDYLNGETNQDLRKNYVERLFENARAVIKGHKG